MVVPYTHDEDHAGFESVTHGSETALGLEGVGVAEDGFLGGAEVVGNRVDAGVNAGDVDLGVLNDLAVLDVEAADLGESAGGGVVGGKELGDDGELGLGVNGHAGTEESLVAHAEGVEVTTILVADAAVAVVTITALSTLAALASSARVRSVGSSHRVGFPDVHLRTAGAVGALAGVGVVGGWLPAFDIGLSRDAI